MPADPESGRHSPVPPEIFPQKAESVPPASDASCHGAGGGTVRRGFLSVYSGAPVRLTAVPGFFVPDSVGKYGRFPE